MSKVIFLTGATGFIGRNLVERILEEDSACRLILLIRARTQEEAEERFEEIFRSFPRNLNPQEVMDRIRVVRGDISSTNLGLDDALFVELSKEVTHIIHSAATVRFTSPLPLARQVNVEGTKNVMAFAKIALKWGNLKQVAYVSTAFVSGSRTGAIYEDDLDCGQKFSNPYEQSKFEAELYVRQLMPELPITIYRPSIVVGNSKTGETSAFNVLYAPLKLIHRGLLTVIPGSRSTPVDVVPIDFVTDAIWHTFFCSEESVGKTFHLTAGGNRVTTIGEVFSLAARYFNEMCVGEGSAKVRFVPVPVFKAVRKLLSSQARRLFQALRVFEPYIQINRAFDNRNAREALQGTSVTPPAFVEYYENLLRYCIVTNWGKRVVGPVLP
jgi:thioester reductase-like protein